MSQQQRPAKPTRDATGRVGVVGAMRATAANAGVNVVQLTESRLRTMFLTAPRRCLLRQPRSRHHRAPTTAVKTP